MPQEFFYPISSAPHNLPTGYGSGLNVGGANTNASSRPGGGRPGPMTHDDATSYLYLNTNEAYIYGSANIDWPSPIGSYTNGTGNITAAVRWAKVSGVALASIRAAYFVNAASTLASAYAGANDQASWATVGPVNVDTSPYRPGGGTWVASDFADDQTIFFACSEGNPPTGYVGAGFTSFWGQLTYSAPSGGFVFLLGLAGALALPHVGRFPDFISFRRYLDWRTLYHPRHTEWSPGEDLVAWRDVQAYRYPTHFLPA